VAFDDRIDGQDGGRGGGAPRAGEIHEEDAFVAIAGKSLPRRRIPYDAGMAQRKSAGCFAMLIFLLVGAVLAAVGWFMMLKPELEAGSRFAEGTCTILGKELVSKQSRSSRPGKRTGGSRRNKTVYRPEFHIRHEVSGKSYEARTFRIVESSTSDKASQEAILARFEKGKTYPCWYDPADPSRVVLERGVSTGSVLFTGLGGLFVLIGAGGLGAGFLRGLAGR